jgi:hypothetical protein
MDKQTAIQAAANAAAVAAQAVNDYGPTSDKATGAVQAVRDAVSTARAHGATDDDIRASRPA